MYEEILQNIIDFLTEKLDDDTIAVTPQSNLMDDLSLSSLEMLHSLIALENQYHITIPEKSLKRMLTVKDVAQVLTEIAQQNG